MLLVYFQFASMPVSLSRIVWIYRQCLSLLLLYAHTVCVCIRSTIKCGSWIPLQQDGTILNKWMHSSSSLVCQLFTHRLVSNDLEAFSDFGDYANFSDEVTWLPHFVETILFQNFFNKPRHWTSNRSEHSFKLRRSPQVSVYRLRRVVGHPCRASKL